MISKKILGLTALVAAGSLPSAFGGIAAMTMSILPDTGDALVEGLPATKTVNSAGDTSTTLATCSGQVRKVIVGTGSTAIVSTQTFDAAGNLLSRRDATGAGTDYAYDELGRRLTETDAQIAGKVRSYTYDTANHLLTATDPLGIVTTYGYDARDRKISESTPMNGTEVRLIQYGYNGRGNMITLTDANGAVTTWTYDNAGRQTAKLYANGDHRSMAYDAAGRLVTLTDENGHDITSTFDLAGRLTTKHFAADNTDDTFVYDAASRMTSVTKGRYADTLTYAYDTAGRLATETHADGTVLHLAYDTANRLANLSLGDGLAYSVAYAHDSRGLLATVTSGDYASRYEYRANGQLTSTVDYRVTNPQGDILRADRTYDASARLLGVANTAANGEQAGVVYTLGVDDQRLSAVEENGQKWNYGYDGLKQLVSAKKTDTAAVVISPLEQSYGYDPMGNRRTYADQSGSTAYTANSANQYAVVGGIASIYDHNGNLLSDGVKNYTWDAENQLVSVTPVSASEGSLKVEYTYDWRMRRTGKKTFTYTSGAWVNTKTTGFKYHEWNPVQETIMDAVASTVSTKFYVWGNDLSGNLHGAGGVGGLLSMKYNSDSYFYAYDGNGNVRALVKADAVNPAASAITARYAYDGFGKEVAVSGVDAEKNAFRFSTKQLDAETGMNYYGYRYYAAGNGRWINRDPLAEMGSSAWFYVSYKLQLLGKSLEREYKSTGSVRQKAKLISKMNELNSFLRSDGELLCGNNVNAFVSNNALIDVDVLGMYGYGGASGGEFWADLWDAGPIDAYRSLRDARKSAKDAHDAKDRKGRRLPGATDGPQDAYRHCLWNCRMVKSANAEDAEEVANNHEEKNKNTDAQKKMDKCNNKEGRDCATDPTKSCEDCCMDKLEGGKLDVLPRRDWVD